VRRTVSLVGVLLAVGASSVGAQTVRIGVHGVTVTHSEISEALKANGLGVGGLLGLRFGRFAFEARGEVGLVRVGLLSEYSLAQIAKVWGRGAYLVAPQFSGGGTAGLAIELSLGTAIGTANGRLRVMGEYEFQRLDRQVDRQDVPLQMTVARFGLELGF
jgi:hypothetical protein